eukprot:TRINITY_DN10104_c0_g1_i1.p1 TRINITY_DN10104_c0_g1~~TRINITY_DN10104_c0_g1_i1.p1  ORF type:complete len:648 (+),score=112.86 TRINITY_DN10104_c0_g1_i1:51-1994(+)
MAPKEEKKKTGSKSPSKKPKADGSKSPAKKAKADDGSKAPAKKAKADDGSKAPAKKPKDGAAKATAKPKKKPADADRELVARPPTLPPPPPPPPPPTPAEIAKKLSENVRDGCELLLKLLECGRSAVAAADAALLREQLDAMRVASQTAQQQPQQSELSVGKLRSSSKGPTVSAAAEAAAATAAAAAALDRDALNDAEQQLNKLYPRDPPCVPWMGWSGIQPPRAAARESGSEPLRGAVFSEENRPDFCGVVALKTQADEITGETCDVPAWIELRTTDPHRPLRGPTMEIYAGDTAPSMRDAAPLVNQPTARRRAAGTLLRHCSTSPGDVVTVVGPEGVRYAATVLAVSSEDVKLHWHSEADGGPPERIMQQYKIPPVSVEPAYWWNDKACPRYVQTHTLPDDTDYAPEPHCTAISLSGAATNSGGTDAYWLLRWNGMAEEYEPGQLFVSESGRDAVQWRRRIHTVSAAGSGGARVTARRAASPATRCITVHKSETERLGLRLSVRMEVCGVEAGTAAERHALDSFRGCVVLEVLGEPVCSPLEVLQAATGKSVVTLTISRQTAATARSRAVCGRRAVGFAKCVNVMAAAVAASVADENVCRGRLGKLPVHARHCASRTFGGGWSRLPWRDRLILALRADAVSSLSY